MTGDVADTPPGPAAEGVPVEDALRRALAAYDRALRLSCRAARDPRRPVLANAAIRAHVDAQAWAEEAVRRAATA